MPKPEKGNNSVKYSQNFIYIKRFMRIFCSLCSVGLQCKSRKMDITLQCQVRRKKKKKKKGLLIKSSHLHLGHKLYDAERGSSAGFASAWFADSRGFDPHVRQHSFVKFGHEKMCTKYW